MEDAGREFNERSHAIEAAGTGQRDSGEKPRPIVE
jgi:hypothetical protein